MSSPYKTFSYYTFGCKVNFADSCIISKQLVDKGLWEVKIDVELHPEVIQEISITIKAKE